MDMASSWEPSSKIEDGVRQCETETQDFRWIGGDSGRSVLFLSGIANRSGGMEHGSSMEAILIKDAIVFLFAAGVVVPIVRLLRLPAIMGFVLAGLILGPGGLGALGDQAPWLRMATISEPEAAQPFAELGVLFLLFLIGLELSFEKLWALRRFVFGAGLMQVGASAALIAFGAILMNWDARTALVAGLALALSSTAIVMQLLENERRSASPAGRTAFGVLLMQDVLVAPILIAIGFLSGGADDSLGLVLASALAQGALAILTIVVAGRFLLRRAFRLAALAGGRDMLMALSLLIIIGSAIITQQAGLSLALGAFLSGVMLGETEFKHQTEIDLEPFKGLPLGLFFMTVGMSLEVSLILNRFPELLAGLVGLLLVKLAVAIAACRLFSTAPAALEAGFLLAPAGEFAFVVLAAASGAVIDSDTAGLLALIAGASMLLTPALGAAGRGLARLREAGGQKVDMGFEELTDHVVIAGFGRVGATLARILNADGADMVALDRDPKRVDQARKAGWKIYFGDASRRELLEKCGARGAALFVVTIDDADSAEAMVSAIRALRVEAPVLARARDVDHADKLYAAGATFVVPDAIEAGLQLASRALQDFGYSADALRDRIAQERQAEYDRATRHSTPESTDPASAS